VEAVTQLVTLLAAGLFAGGALYASVAEHPGRMAAGSDVAVLQFPHSYKRAAPLQGGLAAIALAAGIIAAFISGSWEWALAGGCVGAAVPITLVIIAPVNDQLMSQSGRLTDAEAATLLSRWARLHALRTGFGVAGFTIASVLSAGS
jgi:anthrone oxygenase-like protein